MDKWFGDGVESNDGKLELGRQKTPEFILGKAGKNDNAVPISVASPDPLPRIHSLNTTFITFLKPENVGM